MHDRHMVFLDANVLIYFLDETAKLHARAVASLRTLVDEQTVLYTSHHVIEEVLFIVHKLDRNRQAVTIALRRIGTIPGLNLIEPAADIAFASRYIALWRKNRIGLNDALLLQLVCDAKIPRLFTFDGALRKCAEKLGITIFGLQEK